jgi:prepilin-type N-terminal cleavage/methylation domain-containing protein
MTMIEVLVVLVILGLVLWLIETQLPLSAPIKMVIRVLVVLFIIIWLLSLIGVVSIPMRLR